MSFPFLDSVRERIRVKHYSYSTEQACVGWVRPFIRYHNMCHPQAMGKGCVGGYLR